MGKGKKSKKKGFFGGKKKKAKEENGMLDESGHDDLPQANVKAKKGPKQKKGFFGLFGGKSKRGKKRPRSQTAPTNPYQDEENIDAILNTDNNDLIDQLYNNSAANLPPKQKGSSGFANQGNTENTDKESDLFNSDSEAEDEPAKQEVKEKIAPPPSPPPSSPKPVVEKPSRTSEPKDSIDMTGGDLIDQVYNESAAKLPAVPMSVETDVFQDDNLTAGEPDKKNVNFNQKPAATTTKGSTSMRQSIRNLLTGTNSKPTTALQDQEKSVKKEEKLLEEFGQNDNKLNSKLKEDLTDKESVGLDTEKILDNQYELDTQADDEEDKEKKEETTGGEKEEKKKEEVEDKNKQKETNQENTKLFDFLKSLENDVDSTDEDNTEEKINKTPEVKIDKKKETEGEAEVKSLPRSIISSKSSKSRRRRKEKKRSKAIKISPPKVEQIDNDEGSESEEKEDIDKILQNINFTVPQPRPPEIVEKEIETVPSVRDIEKIKNELREEIREDLLKTQQETIEKDKDKDNKVLEDLKEEQKEFKKLLDKENKIKEDLLEELGDLKKEIKKQNRKEERRILEEKEYKERNLRKEKEKEEENILKLLLKQNEKQLKSIEDLIKSSKEKEIQVIEQNRSDREDRKDKEEDKRLIRESKEIEEERIRREREDKELKRIEKLTKQIELEQKLILEEEEIKQAFEIKEKERLKNITKDINYLENTFISQLVSSPLPNLDLIQYHQDKEEKDRSLSFSYLINFINTKLISPHFEESIYIIFYTCLLILIYSFIQLNTEEEGVFLYNSKLLNIITLQLCFTTSQHMFISLSNLFKISLIFILVDKKPINIQHIYTLSYILNILSLMIFRSQVKGIHGLYYSVYAHILIKGVFSNKYFDRLISLLCLAFTVASSVTTNNMKIALYDELPLFVGGCTAGLITCYLANVKK